MDKTYHLTLNRWHKVAERLSRRVNDMAEELRNGFNQTQVMGYLGEDQQQRLQAEGERLASLLPRLHDYRRPSQRSARPLATRMKPLASVATLPISICSTSSCGCWKP